jgi:hypothetical protein
MPPRARHRTSLDPSDLYVLAPFQGLTITRELQPNGLHPFHISTADQLIGELDRKEKRRHDSLEQPLYFPRLFWVVFVGVLTTEWALRRRFQLR